ncbi:MAG: amidohydrolase family protein [Limnohabitans sp.]
MIDAHFHCWRLDRGDYGWLTPALAPIWRDVTVADWVCRAQAHGIGAGVLVQAAPTEAETSFLLAQADEHAQVLGVVGWVDLLAPDAVARIGQLAQHPKLKGLRPMLQDMADPDWILQPALSPSLQAMADHGLVLDALVRPVHLPRIHTLIGQHPRLRVVIDHGAKPVPQASLEDWADGLRQVASAGDAGRVACKLSGLWTELADRQDLAELASWCEVLLSVWGARRLIWGSDWPVLELAADYDRWRLWSLGFLRQHCTTEECQCVLEHNARQIYRL